AKFESFVFDSSYVRCIRSKTVLRRNWTVEDQVICFLDVIISRQRNSSIQHGEVDPDIGLRSRFPFKVWVAQTDRSQSGIVHVVYRTIEAKVIEVPEFLITGQAVRASNFQIGKYGLVFHKGLVDNSPAQRNGWEVAPTVVFAESGGSICPEAGA